MSSDLRLNQYRIMWIYVLFDLPTHRAEDVKAANGFRNYLIKDGFSMFQFSIYIRHCRSRENAAVHVRRVKQALPARGKVSILTVTDKQFGMMDVFHSTKKKTAPSPVNQLEMF